MANRANQRLQSLLKTLLAHPEVEVFEGDLEGLGRVRLELGRDTQETVTVPEEKIEPVREATPIDWRWGG